MKCNNNIVVLTLNKLKIQSEMIWRKVCLFVCWVDEQRQQQRGRSFGDC